MNPINCSEDCMIYGICDWSCSEPKSIDYETAAALHEESTNDSHMEPIDIKPLERKFNIEYVCCYDAKTLVQMYWPTIYAVRFYDLKYCNGGTANNTVCMWHIKHKTA